MYCKNWQRWQSSGKAAVTLVCKLMVPWPWAELTLFKSSKQVVDKVHGSVLLEKGLSVQAGSNKTGAADDHHARTGLPGLSIAQRLQCMPMHSSKSAHK